jgi:hypothetical protein
MISFDDRKARKIRRIHSKLYAGCANTKSRDLVRFAGLVGRYRIKKGDEPTFLSEPFPYLRPLTIPGHTMVKKFTAKNILDQLEEDVIEIEKRVFPGGE